MDNGQDDAAGAKTDFGISADDVRRLARLVEDNNLAELRFEDGDFRITFRTGSFQRPSQTPPVVVTTSVAAAPLAPIEVSTSLPLSADALPAEEDANSANLHQIEAPVMGVFYRSPAPGESAFVEIGDTVEVGQVVGMIEAMKVFSEVPSDFAGIIRSIPAANGGLVQPGDALLILEAE